MNGEYRSVVLLGAARSGTKFLRSVVSAPEHFCATPFDSNHIWRIGNARAPHDELDATALAEADARTIRRALWKLACPARDDRKGRVLVEKTVSNALRPEFVERVLPGARYIVLLRDGRDVIESTYRMWVSPPHGMGLRKKLASLPLGAFPYAVWYGANMAAGKMRGRGVGIWGVRYKGIQDDLKNLSLPEVCAYQWFYSVSTSLRFAAMLPASRCTTVRFESFVNDPDALGPLCQMLGLDPRDQTRITQSLRTSFQAPAASRWAQAFDPDARERIMKIIEPLQTQLGYPVD